MIVSYDDVRRSRRKAAAAFDGLPGSVPTMDNGIQNSVFQCLLDLDQWVALRAKLLAIVNPQEDSLRFYFLGRNWKSRLEHHGTKSVPALDEGALIT